MLERIKLNEVSYPFIYSFIIVLIVFFLKRPDSILNAQFYAEDATIFFKDAVNGNFFTAISTKYAGYYWTIHRIFAELFSNFNIVYQPLLYSIFAIIVNSSILAFFATKYFRNILENDFKRILISLFLSLMYLDSYEMVNVFINTKWYMTIFLFFFLIADESIIKTKFKKIFFAGIVILIFWTQPQAFYLIPLFIIKCFMTKERLFYSVIILISIFHPIFIFISGDIPSSHLESGNLNYYGLLVGMTIKSNLYFIHTSLMNKFMSFFVVLSLIMYIIIYKIAKNVFSKFTLFSYFYIATSIIFTLVKKKEVTVALANGSLSITPYYFLLINTLTMLILLVIILKYFNYNVRTKIYGVTFLFIFAFVDFKAFYVDKFEDKNWIQGSYNSLICRKSIIKVNPTPWTVEYNNNESDYSVFLKMIIKSNNVIIENNSFDMHPFPDKNVDLSFYVPECINQINLKLYIKKLPIFVEESNINDIGSVKINLYKNKEFLYSKIVNTLKEEVLTIDSNGQYMITIDSNGPNTYDWFHIDVLNIK